MGSIPFRDCAKPTLKLVNDLHACLSERSISRSEQKRKKNMAEISSIQTYKIKNVVVKVGVAVGWYRGDRVSRPEYKSCFLLLLQRCAPRNAPTAAASPPTPASVSRAGEDWTAPAVSKRCGVTGSGRSFTRGPLVWPPTWGICSDSDCPGRSLVTFLVLSQIKILVRVLFSIKVFWEVFVLNWIFECLI